MYVIVKMNNFNLSKMYFFIKFNINMNFIFLLFLERNCFVKMVIKSKVKKIDLVLIFIY